MNDIDAVLKEREERYGTFLEHSSLAQGLKDRLVEHVNYGWLSPFHREALEMICHKMGRIVNGDPNYIDSWVDIAGYAQLVVQILEGAGKGEAP